MKPRPGELYLAATPIGNLEDITYRTVRLLEEADLIAAEDTRHTRKLLSCYNIHTPLTSYHEYNKEAKGPEIIGELLAGKTVVCVSDAGLPGISDPGSDLVRLAIAAGIKVTTLPGACAGLTALVASGLPTDKFCFRGFLPQAKSRRREILREIKDYRDTLIFYEAPHRLQTTLENLAKILGEDRPAVTARELTKKFEEFRRGTLGELAAWYEENEPRGEFVVLVAGGEGISTTSADGDFLSYYESLLADGNDKKSAIRQTAQKFNLSRRTVYQAVLMRDSQGDE